MADSWHSLDAESALEALEVGPNGLGEEEARARLERYGYNELTRRGGPSPWKILLSQFTNPLVIVLIIAAAIAAGAASIEGSSEGWVDAAVIMVIVVVNAIMGFVQEYRAEKTMEALKELASPKVKVIRDGDETEVPSKELVPGDVVVLETGDRVSADGRVLESHNLKVNEASLTGESVPVTKRAEVVVGPETYIGERVNMVFSGCVVDHGRGRAVVTATGMETALGGIAKMVQAEVSQTPLQRKLEGLGKQLGWGVLGISVFIFAFGLLQGVGVMDMFLTAVSLAVAAIPEGLPAVVTISLALGLQRMARCNALVRRLPAVESLGSATVICSDKTGTLTKGEMNIREVLTSERVEVTGEGFEPIGDFLVEGEEIDPLGREALSRLLVAGALCNDARLVKDKEGDKWTIRGDTTEGTLLVTARKAGLDLEVLRKEHPRVFEIPFSSERKRMTTVHEHDGRRVAFLKGAAESVVGLCDTRLVDGRAVELDRSSRKAMLEADREMAGRALRVLAVAMRDVTEEVMEERAVERGFTLLGLVGMIDAPRVEAIEAIARAKSAGIGVKMITGDHSLTAVSIAAEMGIAENGRVLTGKELDLMDEGELSEAVEEVNVYARVAPENKVQILEALIGRGEVVAMTGDGVNDAPALKRADIGIAMGITGTDVSKEASEMVLVDDNFASIVRAVEEGRGIYSNIKKFVSFLLSCNAGEVTTMFLATFIFAEAETLPFLIPIQILWMNLVTDGLPALALGVEPTDPDVMRRPPRDPEEAPIDRMMAYRILVVGAIMALGTLLAFQLEMWDTDDITHSRTVAFCTLVMFQLMYVFSMRSTRKTLWHLGLRSNLKLVYAVIISILLQMAVVYTPGLNDAFGTVPIGLSEWMIIVPIALTAFVASEIWKAAVHRGGE